VVEPTQTWYLYGRKFIGTESQYFAYRTRALEEMDVWVDIDRRVKLWKWNHPNEPYPTKPPHWAHHDGHLLHLTGMTMEEVAGRLRRVHMTVCFHQQTTRPSDQLLPARAVRPSLERRHGRLERAVRHLARTLWALLVVPILSLVKWMVDWLLKEEAR
jgi:hypothetical protein